MPWLRRAWPRRTLHVLLPGLILLSLLASVAMRPVDLALAVD
jgi:hypothetical protein